MCTFTMVTTTATACAASAFLLDLVDAKSENKRSLGSERLSQLSDALDRLVAFLGRVPNELELVHRCGRNSASSVAHASKQFLLLADTLQEQQ